MTSSTPTESTARQRNCSQEKDLDALFKGTKRICIPIERDRYEEIVADRQAFRHHLDGLTREYPELFPAAMAEGYILHGTLPPSKKMPEVRMRRIKMKSAEGGKEDVYTICPSFVLPYMMGYSDEVEKPMLLRSFGVPYWALTYVFGRDDGYWERLDQRLGRSSIVGTTVKAVEDLPVHLLADEKHSRLNGERIYIATTVGQECILGASVALDAGSDSLTEAYGHFKTESQNLNPDYEPETVNIDGWTATQIAWQRLFAGITLILCFLHSFISIRDRCKRMKDYYHEICRQVWEVYHAPDPDIFKTRMAQLASWARQTIPAGTGLDAILKLCIKAPLFLIAYDHPEAYRTSNMIDRHMEPMDRYLYSCRYFHGHLMSAEYHIRAWALLHNFRPYCPRSEISSAYRSRAHRLNGFVYHENWLENLLVSASMGGYRR